MLAYHFTSAKLRSGNPIPPIGTWLIYYGDVIPCKQGLHASKHPFDALRYAPGCRLHRVRLEGDVVAHGAYGAPVDKHVGRRRMILASIDAESLLREFARWCALQVIHSWDAPDVVREYIESGNESLRDAARVAAKDAASAARAAARAAASAAWDAASAAWGAASAARDAASAAGDAARDAALASQRKKLAEMVASAFEVAGGE